jgi:hypothetical protein
MQLPIEDGPTPTSASGNGDTNGKFQIICGDGNDRVGSPDQGCVAMTDGNRLADLEGWAGDPEAAP